jgi:hypothetical protein
MLEECGHQLHRFFDALGAVIQRGKDVTMYLYQ